MAEDLRPVSRSIVRLRGADEVLSPVLAIAAVIGLTACGEPLHPSKWKNSSDAIPEGQGLLTGEDGA